MNVTQQLSFRKQLTPVMAIQMVLDPALIISTLFALVAYYGETLDRNYVLLALVVFALTFPGTWPKNTTFRSELIHTISTWPVMMGFLIFFGYVTAYLDNFSQLVLTSWVLITPLVILLSHLFIRNLLARIRASTYIRRTSIIVGASEVGFQLRDRLQQDTLTEIDCLGFFDDRGITRLVSRDFNKTPLLGKITDLAEYAKNHSVDIIYVALPMSSQPRILGLLDDLKDTTASIYFVPDIFIFDLIQARVDDVAGMPVVAVCETPFHGMNGVIKRLSDVLLASIILLLISPILLMIALGIKLTSPGPVLFKQRRYGLDGENIVVYKFRSMTVTEDGENVTQATKNDKRITPFGAFLRKTSLDELPQFFNVIQGQMSIVGPRPHAVAHNEMYRKLIKGYMIRHKVKPGITGCAQVNGLRGETETIEKMAARIEYDLDYLRQWTLVFDLKIIFRTIFLVFADTKAY